MIPLTQIKLRTSDQHLIAAQKVRIAKGDINSVLLHVEFDSAWEDFTERKVLFSNDSVNGGDTQEVILIGGECIVPPEPLSKSGIMSISVTGYTSDGTTKKTSTIVKLKVLESLSDATTTVEPTMDLYMQYLAAVNEEVNPIAANMNKKLEANIAEMKGLLQQQMEFMHPVILWENPDTTEEIGDEGLVIPIDRTLYPRLHLLFFRTTEDLVNGDNEKARYQDCVCVHENGVYSASIFGDEGIRLVTVTSSTVTIGKSSHTNRMTIPFRILGYKY